VLVDDGLVALDESRGRRDGQRITTLSAAEKSLRFAASTGMLRGPRPRHLKVNPLSAAAIRWAGADGGLRVPQRCCVRPTRLAAPPVSRGLTLS
jgi:hypothetical protein